MEEKAWFEMNNTKDGKILVYAAADNMISSIGFRTAENIDNMQKGRSGVTICNDERISPVAVPISLVDRKRLAGEFSTLARIENYTRLEQMHILSVTDALSGINIQPDNKDTLFIFSSTKGNIDLLERKEDTGFPRKRLYLWESARVVTGFFGNPNKALVISNACISGVLAINEGARLIRTGRFRNVIVTGADIMSEFVVSGFQSFKAISPERCKPFDEARDGINIGEGCGTLILTCDASLLNHKEAIVVAGGGSSNDANHISGPSRTGDGLYLAIKKSMTEAGAFPEEIGYVSAHGTATPYNDEMEARALQLAGLEKAPVNSLKGFFGHTLGAAGILESITAIRSLKENMLIECLGFSNPGVSVNINVVRSFTKQKLTKCLKTASGFGGCNGATVFEKISF